MRATKLRTGPSASDALERASWMLAIKLAVAIKEDPIEKERPEVIQLNLN